ncbi:hypothetical protein [Streptomyces sp. NPDC002851]
MSTTDFICEPGQGRTAGRSTLVATFLLLLTLVVLPPLLAQAGVNDGAGYIAAVFAHIAAATMYLLATSPRQLEMRGQLLTARTLFGRRTVALDRLTKVGRLEIPSHPTSVDWLLLTDEHGVRLAVPAPRVGASEYIETVIAQAVRVAPSGRIRVSRGAAKRLGLPEEVHLDSGLLTLFKVLAGVMLVGVVGAGVGGALLWLSLSLAGEV